MSLDILPSGGERWRKIAPVALLALLLIAAGLTVWHWWPQILLQSIIWQRVLNQEMSGLLQQVAVNPHQAGVTLMGFSLLYGVLHALGPGHGKVVIATFLATHPTRLKTSMKLTLAAAIVQGGVAIALVTLMLGVLQLTSSMLHLTSYWLEKGSYLLVALLGVWLCWRAGKAWWRSVQRPVAPAIYHLRPAAPTATRRLSPPPHRHHAGCGCGHQHVPDSRQLAAAPGWKTSAMVVLSMGLRPCSGAIMMLVFSKVIGVYLWGVFSALVMALGTAFTVSAMALLVIFSRSVAQKLGRSASPGGWGQGMIGALGILGGVALIACGMLLWFSTQPAAVSGIRPLLLR